MNLIFIIVETLPNIEKNIIKNNPTNIILVN